MHQCPSAKKTSSFLLSIKLEDIIFASAKGTAKGCNIVSVAISSWEMLRD